MKDIDSCYWFNIVEKGYFKIQQSNWLHALNSLLWWLLPALELLSVHYKICLLASFYSRWNICSVIWNKYQPPGSDILTQSGGLLWPFVPSCSKLWKSFLTCKKKKERKKMFIILKSIAKLQWWVVAVMYSYLNGYGQDAADDLSQKCILE